MDDGFEPTRASEWIVALAAAPDDPALRARFELWLDADPMHPRDWAEMVRTYAAIGMTVPVYRQHWQTAATQPKLMEPLLPDAAAPRRTAAWRRSVSGTGDHRRQGNRRQTVTGLLGLATAACLSVVILRPAFMRLDADYATGTAQLRSVTLADGTQVDLGPRTALDVAFAPGSRSVRLLSGEAFFKVLHNPARPFSVTAGGVQTTDIGTAFDIRISRVATDVAVREGRVRVDDKNTSPALSQQLTAGQWIRVTADGQTVAGEDAPADIDAWRQGQFVARNLPVSDVVDEIRRYYHGYIVVHGRTLAAQAITGVFNTSNPVAALNVIAQSQGARLTQPLPWLAILTER